MSLNARSIVNKVADLQLLVYSLKPDIICICETWLDHDIDSSSLSLTGYIIFRKDRNRHGGGCLLGVKANLNPTEILHNTLHEVVLVDLQINNVSLRVACAYRPPSQTADNNRDFINFLNSNLDMCSSFVLVGDFNYPGIDWNNLHANNTPEQLFLDFINANYLFQKITEPTRDSNILDLCLCTDNDMVNNVLVHCPLSTSDHNYITCDISVMRYTEPTKTVLNYNLADWDLIRAYLHSLNWDDILQSFDCSEMWDRFKTKIHDCINLYVPKTQVFSTNKVSWSNNHIRRLCKRRDRKWSALKNNPSRARKRIFNNFSKYVKKEVLSAKADYEKKLFLQKGKTSKYFYSYVNRATNTKSDSHIPQLEDAGKIFKTDFEKAQAFSDQYQSVFTIDNNILPTCDHSMPPNSFCSIKLEDEDILSSIREQNCTNSSGVDNIASVFVKKMACFLIYPLKTIFQKSLDTGVVPKDWRDGIIVPIYKKNRKPKSPSSYRPICLTSVICKILERIIKKYMIAYLMCNSLISDSQHGFLENRSTLTNLLDCTNDWTKFIDGKSPVDAIYIDLAKAFDSICHTKMMYKLKLIGIGGKLLDWFQSFLCQRSQSVKVGGTFSTRVPVLSGVGQGTILGPLIFILYMDEVNDLNLSSKTVLYADDAKIYRDVKNDNQYQLLQNDLDKFSNFCDEWQLTINANKCELLQLGHNNLGKSYSLGGEIVPRKTEVKDLGIIISNDMKMFKHCTSVVRKASFRLRQFRIAFSCTDRNFQLYMYKCYIRPLLEYNSQVWSPYLLGDIDRVEKVQKNFTKKLPGLSRRSYPERLQILGLPSLEQRRIMSDLIAFHKMVHGNTHLDRNNFISFSSNNTRGHSLKVSLPGCSLDVRKKFFAIRSIEAWNSLPENLVEVPSSSLFKIKLNEIDLSRFIRGRALMANN